jgi:hypothetical protein
VLDIDPTDASALNNLSLVQHRRGEAFAAMTGFRDAVALDPHSATARRNIDVVVVTLLHRCFWGALALVIAAGVFSGFPVAALTVPAALAVIAWNLRRLDPDLRRYLLSLSSHLSEIGVWALGILAACLVVIPVPVLSEDNVDTVVGTAVLCLIATKILVAANPR